MNSRVLPIPFYSDPADMLEKAEAGDVFRAKGCAACAWQSDEHKSPCIKKMRPGRHWCRGFEEK